MDRAQVPFEAAGLNRPSYVALGNHDGTVQGNVHALGALDTLARGCVKPLAGVTGGLAGLAALLTSPARSIVVPPDPDRGFADRPAYKALHATGRQGDAHGFGFVDPAELARLARAGRLLRVHAEARRADDLDQHGRRGRPPELQRQPRRPAVSLAAPRDRGRRGARRADRPVRPPPDRSASRTRRVDEDAGDCAAPRGDRSRLRPRSAQLQAVAPRAPTCATLAARAPQRHRLRRGPHPREPHHGVSGAARAGRAASGRSRPRRRSTGRSSRGCWRSWTTATARCRSSAR